MTQRDPIVSDALRDTVCDAARLVAFTGAGMSAESGVPTFRDAQTGLWARYDPAELASPEAFRRQPEVVWQWYAWRRSLVARAEPNSGHRALAAAGQRRGGIQVVTQNVDGLHQRAGSEGVLELHGNLHRTICSAGCGEVAPAAGDDREPPPCPHCGAGCRPDVVWFGEALPAAAWAGARDAARGADVLLAIGTSALVQPAASVPMLALEAGATVVEINPEPTPLSDAVDVCLRGTAAAVLPELLGEIG